MLKKTSGFNGKFDAACQENSVTPSLLLLIRMILEGPTVEHSEKSIAQNQARLTIAQLITFNSVSHIKSDSSKIRHTLSRETPLPVYLGLAIHAKTKKEKIDILHGLSLSISYDRVLRISNELGNQVCQQYRNDGVICPLRLKLGITTLIKMDNIDVDTQSTTATGSLHGTGISLSQNISPNNPGASRSKVDSTEPITKLILIRLLIFMLWSHLSWWSRTTPWFLKPLDLQDNLVTLLMLAESLLSVVAKVAVGQAVSVAVLRPTWSALLFTCVVGSMCSHTFSLRNSAQ